LNQTQLVETNLPTTSQTPTMISKVNSTIFMTMNANVSPISSLVTTLNELSNENELLPFEDFITTNTNEKLSSTLSTTLSTTLTSLLTRNTTLENATLANATLENTTLAEPNTHWFLCFLLTFALGGLTAVITKTITAPIEKVKMVQQTFLPQNSCDVNLSELSFFALNAWIYRNLGCLAFWDGNVANCIRYVPKFALDMSVKAQLKTGFKDAIKPGDNPGLQFLSKWLSGTTAAFISGLICYPLDFARTNIAASTDNDSRPAGIIDCWRQTIKCAGFLAIYRGVAMSLCGEVVYRGLKYGLYDSIYDWKEAGLPDVHIVGDFFLNFLIGWFVSSVAGAIAMPFDTVRKILMTDTKSTSPKFDGSISCIKHIYENDGITRFYRGTFTNVIRSWASGLALALFSSLQDLVYLSDSVQCPR